MRTALQFGLGMCVAAGLAVATVALWMHTLIIFAAPVGALCLAIVWVTLDNLLIYPRRKERAAAAAGDPATDGVVSPPETGE